MELIHIEPQTLGEARGITRTSAVRSQAEGSQRKTKPASLWKPAVYCPQHLQQHAYSVSSLHKKLE